MQLPIARYHFQFQMLDPLHLPDYPGSALRGVFGRALRHLACLTRQQECSGCPFTTQCAYSLVFDNTPLAHTLQTSNQSPRPYIIEPDPETPRQLAAGDTLAFNMVLIGPALGQLSLIIHSWQRALAQGLGRDHARALMKNVYQQQGDEWHSIYTPEQPAIQTHEQSIHIQPAAAQQASLHWITPLRLQHNGHALNQHTITAPALLMNLCRRSKLMLELFTDQPADIPFNQLHKLAATLTEQRKLHWYDWQRYSSRQQAHMKLGGLMGQWTLTGELEPFIPWLQLGQWLHTGKETTFGLGQYQLSIN